MATDPESVRKRNRRWRASNKDRIVEYSRRYRERHQDYIQEYARTHRAQLAANAAKRRATKGNQTPDDADLQLIKLIYKHCPDGYHVDHIVPLSKGGLHHQDNLCYLPAHVNLSKGNKTLDEFDRETFDNNVIRWQDVLSTRV
jgi:5-methylcytosine-specific restriction endonuclease McrA